MPNQNLLQTELEKMQQYVVVYCNLKPKAL